MDAPQGQAPCWVVMAGRAGSTRFWAWGRYEGGPGFAEIVLTPTNGMGFLDTEVDPDRIVLEDHLFTVAEHKAWDPLPLEEMLAAQHLEGGNGLVEVPQPHLGSGPQ